ncbi:MAG: tRNA (guanosine(46)-N7)-methyltransferase TrmB [Rhodospirillales bacterium]|nr:tRNA (guanosine(46)-N7)-methyltransferase TrmB [Rhodospirillales bacterium]
MASPTGADASPRFYGRRKSRRLRDGRQRLVDDVLPGLRIQTPEPGGLLDPRALFAPAIADVWMEIGFGAGEHLLAQAQRHPTIGFIGCEPYLNGVAALLSAMENADLGNIRIFPDDARLLLPALAPASIGRLFILFPDPWPKAKHHNRRLVNPATLRAFARILRPGGELRVASDHDGYVRWILDYATRDGGFLWLAQRPADWRQRPADSPATRYQEKAMGRGQSCATLRFERRHMIAL